MLHPTDPGGERLTGTRRERAASGRGATRRPIRFAPLRQTAAKRRCCLRPAPAAGRSPLLARLLHCAAPRRRPDTAPQRSTGQRARGAEPCKAPTAHSQWSDKRAGTCKATPPAANGTAPCGGRASLGPAGPLRAEPPVRGARRGCQVRARQHLWGWECPLQSTDMLMRVWARRQPGECGHPCLLSPRLATARLCCVHLRRSPGVRTRAPLQLALGFHTSSSLMLL